jgi:ribosome-associated protein
MNENTPPVKQPTSATRPTARQKALRSGSIRAVQDDHPTQAVDRRDPNRVNQALENARFAAQIADDNRAKDIVLLDLRQATPLLDFFVIATANSRRQSHAIAIEIDAEMKKRGEHKLGLEGSEEGRWILIDYGDFVVHIFSPDDRAYYALEEIWGDAPRVEWNFDEPRERHSPSTAAGAADRLVVPESSTESERESETTA